MADFIPPTGPPPPKVPEGWKAVWNDQYKEWFYVNIYTRKSQWDRPTEPIYPPGESASDVPPGGPPPSYGPAGEQHVGPEKGGLGANNPYAPGNAESTKQNVEDDEALARRLQAEEDSMAQARRSGAASDFYAQGQPPYTQLPAASPYGSSSASPFVPQEQDRTKGKGGFLSKLLGKGKQPSQQVYPAQPGYGQGGYPQQYPQQYQPYQQYPQQYPQQYAQPGRRPGGGGMGMAGGAALGVGAGLLGGALLADAAHDGGDGGGHGGDDGGGYGGDDGGGFGGDDGGGGGDFGGGDFGGGGF
ncbi:hypothetical protein EJ06DRAFT_533404 [Trichodelitschia bisporula]|uniref:WW domain-containing protein n=1 Tax=Trichodelitschia bisporula TaxID=703511 RepID=A0A6G1HMY0_9PEZI|nr:hypothetical protein EJ06DRAFT_533404 [Trichodelitschia bisporula]